MTRPKPKTPPRPSVAPEGYISAVEAASRLNITGGRLYRVIADGRLVSKRIGKGNGSLWVTEASVEAWHVQRVEWLRRFNGCGQGRERVQGLLTAASDRLRQQAAERRRADRPIPA